ncbi:response regulator [Chloroflexota bacterium]
MKGSNKREITILAVDDEPVSLKLIESALAPMRYKIIKAKNGEEAVNLAHVHKPDLILMDVLMPEMDGYTASSEIRKDVKIRDIPIIMLTSVGHDLNKKLAEDIGANGYIVKPFMIDDLNNKINETLQSD